MRERWTPDKLNTELEIVASGNSENEADNWRIIISGDDLIIQRNVSGTWTNALPIKGS